MNRFIIMLVVGFSLQTAENVVGAMSNYGHEDHLGCTDNGMQWEINTRAARMF